LTEISYSFDRLRIEERLVVHHLQARMRNFYIRISTLALLIIAFFDELATRVTGTPETGRASVSWYFDSPTETIVMGLLAVALCLFVYSEMSRIADEGQREAAIDEKIAEIENALNKKANRIKNTSA